MSTAHTQQQAALTSARPTSRGAARRWRHPFDSATGTIALGVLLTVVLVVALRLFGG
jgi:hypothetical protein